MSHSTFSSLRAPAIGLALAALALSSAGCVRDPTMRLNHAEISGIRVGFPPSLGVQMTVVLDVYNPNTYDVAVRAMRGQVIFAGKYPLAVDYRAEGNGVWLPASRYTQVRVPVTVPVQLAWALVQESYAAAWIPYVFNGRADVTATRTFQLEKDDYSVSAQGTVSRWHMDAALRGAL